MDETMLPFKIGQFVECRSFQRGYRGAWFRCKITKIDRRKFKSGKYELAVALQYYDFPDEEVRWTKLYQKANKSGVPKRQLMVRPCYPPLYHENQLPNANATSEVVAVVNDDWKVGDLIDWWTDNCYWSGNINEVLGKDKFQIELLPPPDGEGQFYEASGKDLRPFLDWSPEHGWTVPIPMGRKNGHSCARLIKPANQAVRSPLNMKDHAVDVGRRDFTVEPTLECNASFSSDVSANSLPPPERPEQKAKRHVETAASKERQTLELDVDVEVENNTVGTGCSESVSSSYTKDTTVELVENTDGKVGENHNDSSKQVRTDGSILLNSMHSNTIEAAILDLEELVNRVKWIKRILESGMPSSNPVQPAWKFIEHSESSTPK